MIEKSRRQPKASRAWASCLPRHPSWTCMVSCGSVLPAGACHTRPGTLLSSPHQLGLHRLCVPSLESRHCWHWVTVESGRSVHGATVPRGRGQHVMALGQARSTTCAVNEAFFTYCQAWSWLPGPLLCSCVAFGLQQQQSWEAAADCGLRDWKHSLSGPRRQRFLTALGRSSRTEDQTMEQQAVREAVAAGVERAGFCGH